MIKWWECSGTVSTPPPSLQLITSMENWVVRIHRHSPLVLLELQTESGTEVNMNDNLVQQ